MTWWSIPPLIMSSITAYVGASHLFVYLRARRDREHVAFAALCLALACYDAFIGIGRANREFYERNGVPPDRIVDGGYFVDEEHFAALRERESPRRTDSRKEWGVPSAACCLLFAGKF